MKWQREGVLQGEVLYSVFNRKLFTAHGIPGDVMTNFDLTEELAGLLAVERPEAVRLLDSFSGAMAGELLASKKLALGGVGSFSVIYVPSEKKESVSGIVYTPPRNMLVFDRRSSGGDDTLRLGVSRMSMSQDEALLFSRSILTLLSGAVQQQREIRLNGFGSFSLENGVYGFFPDRSLEELLNREYLDLEELVLPLNDSSPGGRERKKLPPVLIVSSLLSAALLFAVLYSWRPDTLFSVGVQRPEIPAVTAVHDGTAIPDIPVQLAPAVGGALDSVVLEKGDYTIVLATFKKEDTAIKELAALRPKGIKSFVWEVSSGRVKYYRLVTGSFSGSSEAAGQIRGLSEKTQGSPYIQHIIRKVVLYGKKGL